jgi:hypothetical protein
MGKVILGAASSHAFAVLDPAEWDEARQNNRRGYERRYNVLPAESPHVAGETDEVVARRYGNIRLALDSVRVRLAQAQPDALVMIADDQNENFTDTNLPQIAIYVGQRFLAGRLEQDPLEHRSHPELAEAILRTCVEADVDMACIRKLPDDRLFAHAFGPVLRVIDPEAKIPVVPVFVNAIHMPAPSPSRCYFLGQLIGRAVEDCSGIERVALYGSGGLSHFTAGYPYAHYDGPLGYGEIDVDFDRWLIDRMRAGDGQALGKLSVKDLLDHGEIELRSWIAVLGALGQAKPQVLAYEPFYRGIMGMGVACWDLSS